MFPGNWEGIGRQSRVPRLDPSHEFLDRRVEENQMSLRPCRPCPRPRFIPIGPVEEAKVQDDITPQAQHSLGNLKLDLSDSLTALEVIAIADDPRHPDVGRQHQSGSLALQAAGEGRLA
jgi:hypothetical protein